MKETSHKRNSGRREKSGRVCQISHQTKGSIVPGALVNPKVVAQMQKEGINFSSQDFICAEDLNRFRFLYVQDLLASEKGELSSLDQEVLGSLQQHELLSSNVNEEFDETQTFGALLADKFAELCGSWKFILSFCGVLMLWIGANATAMLWKPFDPYPFILLNFVLSCLAAIQAPLIMMSQNRQQTKDRMRAENDYCVNLKTELCDGTVIMSPLNGTGKMSSPMSE